MKKTIGKIAVGIAFTGIAAFGLNAGFTNQAGHTHFPSPPAPSFSEGHTGGAPALNIGDTGGAPQLESVGDYGGAPANSEHGTGW
ncbi:hypothetical protein [Bacillus thuringiensis]|uniref:Phr family secreted Rap phosphatase inhibitor n=1 Tax=Bacillus thuringiensis serovar andalousiensis TaxID=257985 RepID=A0A6H0TH58_BACTU|nr:hypothetical protein [Bacillus thuringiensis]QIW19807.1 hypothetical protein EVG22_15810 [Bacillus thuringiensis serovar andalousiensis]